MGRVLLEIDDAGALQAYSIPRIVPYTTGDALYLEESGVREDVTGGSLTISTDLLTLNDKAGSPQLVIETVPNAVNYWRFQGAATGTAPTSVVDGDDTDISTGWYAKGVGVHNFGNDRGVQFSIGDEGSGNPVANNLKAVGGIANADPKLTSTRGVRLNAASGQTLFLTTNDIVQLAVRNIEGISSTDCYPVLAGGATFGRLQVEGGDTNIGMFYQTKGNGSHIFWSSAAQLLTLAFATSAVNGFIMRQSATGSPVAIEATGSDTDIDILFTPKGAGRVRFGTHAALAGETVTGYITVKDAGGTSRKIAVVS